MSLFKPPKGGASGQSYPPNQAWISLEIVVIGTGQNYAKELNNLDNSKLVTEFFQPSTIDTVNMNAGNVVNI